MKKQRSSFPLRAPEEVMEWLKVKAKKNDRPVNYVAVKLLESAMRREQEGLA